MDPNNKCFALVSHNKGLTLGVYGGEVDGAIVLKGALDVAHDNNNFIVFIPVVPNGVTWDIKALKEASTSIQKSQVLAHTVLDYSDEHELLVKFVKYWGAA